jgi:hypothetical protein
MVYRIRVYDNFNYTDETEADTLAAVYATDVEAISAAKGIVDRSLRHLHAPGQTVEQLLQKYRDFGDDPAVVCPPDTPRPTFSAWQYAQERCAAIVAELATG